MTPQAGQALWCPACGNGAAVPQVVYVQPHARRSVLTTYLLWFFLGWIGIHHFYLGNTSIGCLYVATGGFCLIGWIVDLFLIPSMVRRANGEA